MNASTSAAWPSVSVIVPHYNDSAHLRICLGALMAQDYPDAPEIIVVDNGSTDDLAEVRAEFLHAMFLEEPGIGSYRARNTGIAQARGEILAFTDSDCIPNPDWLRCAVARLMREDGVGVVGGKIDVFAADPQNPNPYEIYDIMNSLNQKQFVERYGYAATANMITRRVVIQDVGLFNQKLLSSGDMEWGQRVAQSPWRTVFEDRAIVRHPARGTKEAIRARIRRIIAGGRDVEQSLTACIVMVAHALVPPLRGTLRLAQSGLKASRMQMLAFFIFAWQMRWLRAYERLRLQVTRSPSPRA